MSRVALVTGAGRGIGRAVALELARCGRDVAVNYRASAAAAEELVQEILQLGQRGVAIKADVSKSDEAAALFAQVKDQLGPVEILVNNAGVTKDGLLMRMKDADWQDVIKADLDSVFYCTREAVKAMVRGKWGRIVNLASVVGLIGNPGQANYCAAKAGIIGFSKSVAREYASKGITVNCVAPGFIATDMTGVLAESAQEALLSQIPVGRPGTPQDVAQAIAFLTADGSSYITGQVLAVDGGMTMV